MSYTPPSLPLNVTWEGTPDYTEPTLPLEVSWQESGPAAVGVVAAIPSPLGVPAALAVVVPAQTVEALVSVPSPLGIPAAQVRPVSRVVASVGSPLGVPSAAIRVPLVAAVAIPSPLGAPACQALVRRYELRGIVRNQGVPVNRTVRAHRLSDGALTAEGATAAGLFALPAGFEEDDYYVLALYLDPEAADYAPPVANRVRSVLALDT